MAIFRFENLIAIGIALVCGLAVCNVFTSIRTKHVTLNGGIVWDQSENPLLYLVGVGFYIFVSGISFLVVLDLLFGIDVRFWL